MINTLLSINDNRYMWGVSMLLVNLGSRFLASDLGVVHEMILNNVYMKKVVLFAIFFMASRDIITSFLLTILYVIIIDGLLHEKRRFCIIPKKYRPNGISELDYLKAKSIVEKYERNNKNVVNKK